MIETRPLIGINSGRRSAIANTPTSSSLCDPATSAASRATANPAQSQLRQPHIRDRRNDGAHGRAHRIGAGTPGQLVEMRILLSHPPRKLGGHEAPYDCISCLVLKVDEHDAGLVQGGARNRRPGADLPGVVAPSRDNVGRRSGTSLLIGYPPAGGRRFGLDCYRLKAG
jgi:hypothetical protein